MGYNPSQLPGADRPVEMVSWDDCQEFSQKMTQPYRQAAPPAHRGRMGVRRPAGSTGEYFNGNGEDALKKVGWYVGNGGSQTHVVGEKKVANPGACSTFTATSGSGSRTCTPTSAQRI